MHALRPKPARRDGSTLRLAFSLATLSTAMLTPLMLVGCAGGTSSRETSASNTPADPLLTLKEMALREQNTPNEAARALSPAPGVDVDAVRPLDAAQLAAGSAAVLSINDAIAAASKSFSLNLAPPPTGDEQLDLESKTAAMKAYASGLQKLADERVEDGLADLMQAKELDPRSPHIWRAIGDAYALAGRRPSALGAYQQAIRQGGREARLFAALGREALRTRRLDVAVGLLDQARKCPDAADDEGVRWLVTADMGEALADLGYLDAARQLLASLREMPIAFPGQTRMRPEVSDLYRRRAELLQRSGDLSMKLGRGEEAAQSYAAAAMWESIDPGAVLARRVDALTRLGRPGQASLVLLEEISRDRGQIDERQLSLIRWLAGVQGVATPLADGLGAIERDLGTNAAPSAASRLLLARAAVLSDADARTLLRQHLLVHPTDTETLGELLRRVGDSATARGGEIAPLANARPDLAELYSETMIAHGVDVLRTIGALESDNKRGSRLVAAHALQKLGLFDRSWSNVAALPGDAPESLADRATLAAKLGKYDEAARVLDAIPQERRVERAIALRALQRYRDAYEAIESAANAAATPATLMLAAELALRTGRVSDTERFLRAVVEKDPGNEQAAESLISIYSPPSPIASDDKLGFLVRSIRESQPSSRVIRQLAARELLQRGLWSQAEAAFIGLAEQGTPLPDDVDALVSSWERQVGPDLTMPQAAASIERGERWLGRKLERHPDSPWLIAGLARLHAASGEGTKAETLLAEHLKAMPLPDLARQRERVIRDSLNRPEDADEMALQRLAVAPRTIETALERAETLARAGRAAESAEALRAGTPADVPLSGEQASRLAALIGRVTQTELQASPTGSPGATALMEFATARRVPLSPQLQDARIALMYRQRPDDTDAIREAITAISQGDENRAEATVRRAGQLLFTLGDRLTTLRFLIVALSAVPTAAPELCQNMFALTAQHGSADDARAFAAALGDERIVSLMQIISNTGLAALSPGEARVEFFRTLGDAATSIARDEAAEEMYRAALTLDPAHAMTNNNLGYFLLDAGRKLEDAAVMIERAYRAEPNAANIIDSLAWLRYKQGVIEDRRSPTGKVEMEGAITLLLRASDLEGDSNFEMLDHLGDAQFKAGRPDDAKRRWQQALELVRGEIEVADAEARIADRRASEPGQQTAPISPAMKRLRDKSATLADKIAALSEGRVPAVSPSGVLPPPPLAEASGESSN